MQVFDEDLAAFGAERAARFIENDGEKRFMRMEDGHCAALDLSGGLFRCSIYEVRPLICRVYQEQGAGSACLPSPSGRPAPPNLYRASAENDWPAGES